MPPHVFREQLRKVFTIKLTPAVGLARAHLAVLNVTVGRGSFLKALLHSRNKSQLGTLYLQDVDGCSFVEHMRVISSHLNLPTYMHSPRIKWNTTQSSLHGGSDTTPNSPEFVLVGSRRSSGE